MVLCVLCGSNRRRAVVVNVLLVAIRHFRGIRGPVKYPPRTPRLRVIIMPPFFLYLRVVVVKAPGRYRPLRHGRRNPEAE